jgi:OOP family OmpA-OmpF porin
LLAGCSPTIPKELITARNADQAMNGGAARTLAPAETRRANEAMEAAEQSFQDTGASMTTRELANEATHQAEEAQIACARKGAPEVAAAPQEVKVVEEKLKEVLKAVPGTMMFEFDKSELRPAAKQRLDQLAAALNEAKKLGEAPTLVIEGHADAIGTVEYNKALSARRANAVRQYLSSKGYDQNLIQVSAMGKKHPWASNADPEGRADNRRVEIKLGAKKENE